jgi:arylesterase/paraoxonase
MLANRPGKFQAVNEWKRYEVRFRDRMRNCEDVVLVETEGVAVVSCDGGRDRWNTVMVSRGL